MTFTIKDFKKPNTQKVTSVLRTLPISEEKCAEFDLAKKNSVCSTMTRLKQTYGLSFESHVHNDKLLVWRVA